MKSDFSSKLHFSRRVVFVFASIVAVPLVALFSVIIALMNHQAVAGIEALCNREIELNAETVQGNIQATDLMEKMVYANSDLMLFMTSPEVRGEEEIIRFMREENLSLERIFSVVPMFYSVRLFSDNPSVPERFPVFLSASRTDLASLNEWEFNYCADFMGTQNVLSLPTACQTKELKRGRRHVGWLQVSVRMEDFFPFLADSPSRWQRNFAFIVSEDGSSLTQLNLKSPEGAGQVLSEKDVQRLGKAIFSEKAQVNPKVRIGGSRSIVAWKAIPELGIVIVHTCSVSMVMKSLLLIVFLSLAGLFSVMLCFFLIVRSASNRMFHGIYSVMEGMQKVRAGNMDVQIEISGDEEVRETQLTFNAMTQQLSAQIEQIKAEQQLIADTEMKAMQNQINAHFLYNVLETIHMQAVLADNDDVAQSILMLGKMMRYCLRWRIHTVTLEKEMEYIQSYVYILNVRNDYEVKLRLEIPDSQHNLKIPKMIVQPFVENSFIHGIEPLARDTEVRIFTEIDEPNQKIWLCVEDAGAGMSQEKIDEILSYLADEKYERDSTGSIGIKNIQQRLFMFYGKDFALQIRSTVGKGTLVRIPLPIEGDTRQ